MMTAERMTIKQIAQKYGIEYHIVYFSLGEAGMIRYGKGNLYDEVKAIDAISKYLTCRIDRHKEKIVEYLKIMKRINIRTENEGQKQG